MRGRLQSKEATNGGSLRCCIRGRSSRQQTRFGRLSWRNSEVHEMEADMFLITNLPTIMGAVLIVAGMALVLFQMVKRPPPIHHQVRASIEPTQMSAQTAYPGLVMICLGVL